MAVIAAKMALPRPLPRRRGASPQTGLRIACDLVICQPLGPWLRRSVRATPPTPTAAGPGHAAGRRYVVRLLPAAASGRWPRRRCPSLSGSTTARPNHAAELARTPGTSTVAPYAVATVRTSGATWICASPCCHRRSGTCRSNGVAARSSKQTPRLWSGSVGTSPGVFGVMWLVRVRGTVR
jgi:hypothetical protein